MKKFLLCACLLTCFLVKSGAQGASPIEFGIGVGGGLYQGDLSPYPLGTFSKTKFSFQTFFQYNFHRKFTFRANYALANLEEDDSQYKNTFRERRNFRFEASVNELSAHLIYSPLNTGDEMAGNLRTYIFGGIGVAFLSVQRDFSNFDRDYPYWQRWVRPGLTADSLHALPTSAITVPIGAGLRYYVTDNVSLFGEFSHRLTREEYLDGFSRAANTRRQDAFSTATIGIILRFGDIAGARGGYGCPVNVY